MKHLFLTALFLFSIHLCFGQKVTLSSPANGAKNIRDPFDTTTDINPAIIRFILIWNSVPNATEYEIAFRTKQIINGANGSRIFSMPGNDNNNDGKLDTACYLGGPNDGGLVPGSGLAQIACCFNDVRPNIWYWKVRAKVGGVFQPWSDEWTFSTVEWVFPNKRDQQLLEQVGWYKPTVWDSTTFYAASDVAKDLLDLHKESYKAQGDLIAHLGSKIYIEGKDPALRKPVIDIMNENKKRAGDHANWTHVHYDAIADGKYPNKQGVAHKGIGHSWPKKSVDDTKANLPGFFNFSPIQDTHEWTHNFEASRWFSGRGGEGEYWQTDGVPLWFNHMTSNPFRYYFNRDYGFPLSAKYEANFSRPYATDSLGKGYAPTIANAQTALDLMRHEIFYGISNFRGDINKFHRDSLFGIPDDHRFATFAGHYLSYLTSPQMVFIDKFDNRAWTKPFYQQFKDAFGMTLVEFSRKFYDWMLTVDPIKAADIIISKEHSTKLFHYPKLFTTSYPLDEAKDICNKPKLSWKASTDFSSYQIQISKNKDFSSLVHTMDVKGVTVFEEEVTSATLDTTLSPNTKYYWRMKSILGVKNTDWTEAKSFTTSNIIPAPVVNNVSSCVGSTASALIATALSGNTLRWYGTNATGGTASSTPPTPSAVAAGTTDYYVSQVTTTACESPRAKITVMTKPTPPAPVVNNVSSCVGSTASALIATALSGNTLRWYGTNATGGTASSTPPTPSAVAAGTTDYYVSQVTTTACESPRAKITVMTKPTPPAPTLIRDTDNNLVTGTSGTTWYKDGIALPDTTQKYKPTTSGSYSAKTTINGCTSVMSAVYNYLLTDIFSLSKDEFIKLVPNPFQRNINVDFVVKGYQKLNMDIFEMSTGIRVISRVGLTSGETVYLPDLIAGSYIVKVSSADGKLSYQFKMLKM